MYIYIYIYIYYMHGALPRRALLTWACGLSNMCTHVHGCCLYEDYAWLDRDLIFKGWKLPKYRQHPGKFDLKDLRPWDVSLTYGRAPICPLRRRDHCIGICIGYASGYVSSDHPFWPFLSKQARGVLARAQFDTWQYKYIISSIVVYI